MMTWRVGGQEFGVVVNWNVIRNYCRLKGISDISQLDKALSFDVDGVLTMAHCCIREGERLSGRTLELTEEDLGAIVGPTDMTNFLRVYVELSTARVPVAAGDTSAEKKTGNP